MGESLQGIVDRLVEKRVGAMLDSAVTKAITKLADVELRDELETPVHQPTPAPTKRRKGGPKTKPTPAKRKSAAVSKIAVNETTILTALAGGALAPGKLARQLGAKPDSIKRVCKALITSGKIRASGPKGPGRKYEIVDGPLERAAE